MSTDPMKRLPAAFGLLVRHLRAERDMTAEALAAAAGLTDQGISNIELGRRDATLTEIFRIANALHIPAGMFLIEVIGAWRNETYDLPIKSRPSDFAKLYRLGYHHAPGDFREHPTNYFTFFHDALAAARKLNTVRAKRNKPLLDTVCIYVRMHYVNFTWEPIEVQK